MLQAISILNELFKLEVDTLHLENKELARLIISHRLGQDNVDRFISLDVSVPRQWPQSLRNHLILGEYTTDSDSTAPSCSQMEWIRDAYRIPYSKRCHKLTFIGPPIGKSPFRYYH